MKELEKNIFRLKSLDVKVQKIVDDIKKSGILMSC